MVTLCFINYTNPDAIIRALAGTTCLDIVQVCKNIDGVYIQIGKPYQYKEDIRSNLYVLLKALKKHLTLKGRKFQRHRFRKNILSL